MISLPIRSSAPALPGALALLRGWLRDRIERRTLAELDERALRDIGIGRADVEREYQRPFWQRIDYASLEAARRAGRARVRT